MRRPSLCLLGPPLASALLVSLTLAAPASGAATQAGSPPDAQRARLASVSADVAAHGLRGALEDAHGHQGLRSQGAVKAAYATSTAAPTVHAGVPGSTAKTLVLFDTTGQYGWLGELYATLAGNLSSHFGSWVAAPVSAYTAGQSAGYTAVIYVGSTYDEPIPSAFLDDVLTSATPVLWMNDNIWQLEARATASAFATRYGYNTAQFDFSSFSQVAYKGQQLTRDGTHGIPLMTYSGLGAGTAVTTVATASTTPTDPTMTASTVPWALRSSNLTYVGENPFVYSTETDRLRVFEDMLFDLLAPSTPARHRALVRLEDINPMSDPTSLRADADYLYSKGVPFGFGVSPLFVDPTAAGYSASNPLTVKLSQRPELVNALKYLQSRGGVLVEHGYTHQWSANLPNPYTGVTGDDYEFYRVTENTDDSLNYVGPLPGDSQTVDADRISKATAIFNKSKLSPTVFEFPHYASSVAGYNAAAAAFSTRWERGLYFGGVLSGGTVDYTHLAGQTFPYKVRDAYGSVVLPEDLGDISLTSFYGYPVHDVSAVLDSARANLVLRDGAAGFFFHPFLDISYLKSAVEGMQSLGYTFAAPGTV